MLSSGHKIKNQMKINDFTTEFLQHRKIKNGVCYGTLDKYSDGFKKISKTMGNPNVFEIKQSTVFDWEIQLEKEYLSSNRRRFLVGLFQNFLAFLRNVKKLEVYDYREISLPKPEYKPVRYLTEKEIEKIILGLPEKSIYELRFKALFCLLVSSGARINEVLNLKLKDVKFDSREALVLGKGNRYRKIFFDERAKYYLNQYLIKKKVNEFLFSTINKGNYGERWNNNDVNRKFRQLSKKLNKRIHPHLLRTSFGCNNQMDGMPLPAVSAMLGHSSPRVTDRYVSVMRYEDAREVYRKFERKFAMVDAKANIQLK